MLRACIIEGKRFDAAANLGIAPTLPHAEPMLEVHMFDMQENSLWKAHRSRAHRLPARGREIPDLEALKIQIAADCDRVRELLAKRA